MFFLTMFIALMVVLALCAVYLATRFHKIWLQEKKNKDLKKSDKVRLWVYSLLPLLPLVVACILDNYVSVLATLHVIVFWIIFDVICELVAKISKKKISPWLPGILAVSATVIYLTVSCYIALHVQRTDYQIKTDKAVSDLRVALIADSHIGTCFDGEGFGRHLSEIEKTHPDILVISGDFVDDDTKRADMIRCCEELGKFESTYGVFYVPGNHDKGYSDYRDFTYEEMLEELRANHVYVLEDEAVEIAGSFYVVGRKDRSMKRLPIDELLAPLDPEKYMIVLDHQPNDYDAEAVAGCDLVLSGHTHGGQMLPINKVGEWLRINDATYGLTMRKGSAFIVTSGIADWAIPFKSGTVSEYCIIDISKNG